MQQKLETPDTAACWIWADYPGKDLINSWIQCRLGFELEELPSSAPVHVTADSRYRLFVNGQRVMDGPCRGFQDQWPYDSIDIAPLLRRGKNVVAALVHSIGVGTFSYIHRNCAGFLLWGHAGSQNLKTDQTWKTRFCPEHLRHQVRTSVQTGWQEFVDARRGDGPWVTPEYDDSHWASRTSARRVGCAPWHDLVPRDIPPLREIELTPSILHSSGEGNDLSQAEDEINIANAYLASQIEWHPTGNPCSTESIVGRSSKGKARGWCFDLEREVNATTRIKIHGAHGGEVLDCLMTEACEGSAPVMLRDEPRMQFSHRYICREGDQEFESFQSWGYRFLVVLLRGEADILFSLTIRHTEYPLHRKGKLVSKPALAERVYELCAHTQQACMSDAYVDCPSREQAMWWGDAHTQFASSQLLDADDRLVTRGLRLMGRQTLPNGLTYGVAPCADQCVVLPDFTLRWIETHWQHWWFSGSTELFRENIGAILDALEYFHDQSKALGLLPFDPRYWLFLDWSETFKEGYPSLYNFQYLQTLERAAEMLELIASPQAQTIRERWKSLNARIADVLWDSQGLRPYAGLDWEGRPVRCDSLHARVLAILTGLWRDHHVPWLEEAILPFVRGPKPKGFDPSAAENSPLGVRQTLTPYFMQYAFEALCNYGYPSAVVDSIGRWWGEMIARGLVATEEVCDTIPGRGSHCHAWSSHPIQFLSRTLLGVTQTAVAWRRIRFAPCFHGESAEGTVSTPLGTIQSRWCKHANTVDVELVLPAGMDASIEIPGTTVSEVRNHWRGKVALL